MGGIVEWFERRGEIPLLPPLGLREYGPLTDDPDRAVDEHLEYSIRGVACAIEYCDAHGWMSTRTIRCLAIDPRHPACLSAYCHVRDRIMSFRVDRIISIVDLRSGRMLSSSEHLALLAPYLPNEDAGSELRALLDIWKAVRDGVFALLQVAMMDGALNDGARDIVLEYVAAEAAASGCAMPPSERIELWVDNLSPSLDDVADAVAGLLDDREKFARLLPWLLKVARGQESLDAPEESLHDLFEEVRKHFRGQPHDFPRNLRATR